MKHLKLPMVELVGIAATRGMLGAGIALLLGNRLCPRTRRVLGLTLTAIGLVSTPPLVRDVLHHRLLRRD